MRVAVGSLNPIKVGAVTDAAQRVFGPDAGAGTIGPLTADGFDRRGHHVCRDAGADPVLPVKHHVDLRDVRPPMPGTLYFGCGNAAEEAPLWLSMLWRPTTRIVYWPFALPAELGSSADQWLRGNLDALGVGYELDTWQTLDQHRPSELTRDGVDLLFVGGGNTFRLLEMVQRCGFLEPVRQFWQTGGDYYGGSAGAVLACETIEIAEGHDPNDPRLEHFTGLGLLSGAAILPHFTDQQLAGASEWAEQHRVVVLGLPESAGLCCVDATATVVGAGQVSRIMDGAVDRISVGESFDIVAR